MYSDVFKYAYIIHLSTFKYIPPPHTQDPGILGSGTGPDSTQDPGKSTLVQRQRVGNFTIFCFSHAYTLGQSPISALFL